jgi:hypothetical protein
MYVTPLTIVKRFGSDAVVREFRDFDNRRRARLALVFATKQSSLLAAFWIASRSLSSAALCADPLARNDGLGGGPALISRARHALSSGWHLL